MDIQIEVQEDETTGERVMVLEMIGDGDFSLMQEANAEEVRSFISGLQRALLCLEGGEGNL